jgi:hypothetical protein
VYRLTVEKHYHDVWAALKAVKVVKQVDILSSENKSYLFIKVYSNKIEVCLMEEWRLPSFEIKDSTSVYWSKNNIDSIP